MAAKRDITLDQAKEVIAGFVKNGKEIRSSIVALLESYNVWYLDRRKQKAYYTFSSLQTHIKAKDVVEPEKPVKQDTPLSEKLKKLLKTKEVYSIESISDLYDTGISKVKTAIDELASQGFNISLKDGHILFSDVIEKKPDLVLSVKKMSTGFHRFAAVGDTHLCSKYERLELLNILYDLFEQEGIKDVYHTGNWIDGEAKFNRNDLLVHGMDNQINYMIANYPQRKGITTRYVAGDDHEGWYTQSNGIDIGKYLQLKAIDAGRTDLVYLGYMEHDIIYQAPSGQTKLRVLHPGGGSSYAVSYTVQKIVESYQGGEKPDILLVGHYHKADYIYVRGVHAIQTGCVMDQSPFMRKKKLAAHLGGWIIEFATDDNGAVTRFKQEFIPFYDNKYYKQWEYKQ